MVAEYFATGLVASRLAHHDHLLFSSEEPHSWCPIVALHRQVDCSPCRRNRLGLQSSPAACAEVYQLQQHWVVVALQVFHSGVDSGEVWGFLLYIVVEQQFLLCYIA